MDKLDLWAIQRNKDELEKALANIKSDNDIIIYTDLISNLKMGNMEVSRQFNTLLYSEENDLAIILMYGGSVSYQDLIEALNNKRIRYVEVKFLSNVVRCVDKNKHEMWFVRDIETLKEALMDSLDKGKYHVEYYPRVSSSLEFNYLNNALDEENVYEYPFFGLLRLEDKFILLLDNKSIKRQDVMSLFKYYKVRYKIYGKSKFGLEYNLRKVHNHSVEKTALW